MVKMSDVRMAFYLATVPVAVFLLCKFMPGRLVALMAIQPRALKGLFGILFSPLVHAGLYHLFSNVMALFILFWLLLSLDRKATFEVLGFVQLASGLAVWILGSSNSSYVGASGVVFGLIGFLLGVGVFQKSSKALLISIFVLFFFGGSILMAVIPLPGISWIAHIAGLASGFAAASLYSRQEAQFSRV